MLFCMTTSSLFAYDFEISYSDDGGYTLQFNFIQDKTAVEIAQLKSRDSNVRIMIPASVQYRNQEYPVRRIGASAFQKCQRLIAVSMPEGIESIGRQAFSGCLHLTEMTIPESVTEIDEYAFWECSGLRAIVIPPHLTTIRKSSFCKCFGLESVMIPEGVTTIEGSAFENCFHLRSVSLPSSLTTIGMDAFKNTPWQESQSDGVIYLGTKVVGYSGTMPPNTEIIIKPGTTAINASAFYRMKNLSSVILPESLTEIGHHAFSGCENLRSIHIPANVDVIEHDAFYGCTNLHKITLPAKLKTLESNVFNGCSSLQSIEIPENVSEIAENSFLQCKSLTSVTLPSNLASIGANAFASCTSLKSLTLPNTTQAIGRSAFSSCIALESIVLPKQLTMIEDGTFNGCRSLTSIVLPASLTSIGNNSFNGCNSLTSLSLPNHVTSIGYGAFYNCKELRSFVLPTDLETIEDYAFGFCDGLTSIIIPEKVSSIAAMAYLGCKNLKTIRVEQGNSVYDSRENCNAIIETLSNTLIAGCQGSLIPHSVTTIGPYALYGCSTLSSIAFHEGLVSIGNYAVGGCPSLTSILIPKSLTDIAPGAFAGCTNIQTIKVTDGNPMYDSRNDCNAIIKTETNLLVAGCSATKIPNEVKTIGASAFLGCRGAITLPPSINSIESGAFRNMLLLCESATPPTAHYSAFSDLLSISCFAIVPEDAIQAYQEAVGWNKVAINSPFYCDGNFATKVRLITSPAFSNSTAILNGVTYMPQNDTIIIDNLSPGETYEIETQAYYGDRLLHGNLQVTTKNIDLYVSAQDITNETVTLKGTYNIPSTDYFQVASCGVENYGKGEEVTITGLTPGKQYSFTYYVEGIDGSRYTKEVSIETKPVYLYSYGVPHATSCHLCGGYYNVIDAQIVEAGFKGYKQSDVVAKDLLANTKYTFTYEVKFANGDSQTQDVVVYTDYLTLKTLQPRIISSGNVIVAATSNFGDEETNVGFEWRRTDWTDDFASNTGNAYLYGGRMEGYIRNLNTNYLWKCRPYYESATGSRYYGDWVGIDPSNTSYFEPTVHTYATYSVDGNQAKVKGYALTGTDKVTSQGFVYWPVSTRVKAEANSAPAKVASVPDDAKTVTAKGVVMEASLTGLEYNTTYCYAAFVTTSEGETFYGEMQTFTTGEDLTPVESVEVTPQAVSIEAIYDASGRRQPRMQRGLNIIRMSDGTTRKVLVK